MLNRGYLYAEKSAVKESTCAKLLQGTGMVSAKDVKSRSWALLIEQWETGSWVRGHHEMGSH